MPGFQMEMLEPSLGAGLLEACNLVIHNTFLELVDCKEVEERTSRRRTRSLDLDRLTFTCSKPVLLHSTSTAAEAPTAMPSGSDWCSKPESLHSTSPSPMAPTAMTSRSDADRNEFAGAENTERRCRQGSSTLSASSSSDEQVSSRDGLLPLTKQTRSSKRPSSSPEVELINIKARLNGATTVMVQNIRKEVTQAFFEYYVVQVLGFGDQFDFLYAPTCFQTGTSRGYGFVNFLTTEKAAAFSLACAHRDIRVTRADLQGREAYVSRFSKRKTQRVRNKTHKPIMCNPKGRGTQ
eukprot:TRINITY_DN1158_c0_g2_i3.p1 TRINITY_DN1158_c0_g2~~TRINITY_DN1158_c0_g2_i3.p1  ORF type:complete len:294 (+),score=41.50 TRINITY_DN1158_c0_g2_i3:36-917(+)